MPRINQMYELRIGGNPVGALNGPGPQGAITNAGGGFKQNGAGAFSPLDITSWVNFRIVLSANYPLPDGFRPGNYTLTHNWKDMSVAGSVTNTSLTPAWTRDWVATAINPSSRNWEYSLQIGGHDFGTLVYDGSKVTFRQTGSSSTVEVQWTSWETFGIISTLATANNGFSPGTYNFTGGQFTRIAGTGTKPGRQKDEPTTWEATAQVGGR